MRSWTCLNRQWLIKKKTLQFFLKMMLIIIRDVSRGWRTTFRRWYYIDEGPSPESVNPRREHPSRWRSATSVTLVVHFIQVDDDITYVTLSLELQTLMGTAVLRGAHLMLAFSSRLSTVKRESGGQGVWLLEWIKRCVVVQEGYIAS